MMSALADRAVRTQSGPPSGVVMARAGAVCGVAFTVLTVATAALPRWTCLVALATSVLMLVDIIEDLATTGTNLDPLGLVEFGLANVWIVGVCVAAWRQPAAVISAEG